MYSFEPFSSYKSLDFFSPSVERIFIETGMLTVLMSQKNNTQAAFVFFPQRGLLSKEVLTTSEGSNIEEALVLGCTSSRQFGTSSHTIDTNPRFEQKNFVNSKPGFRIRELFSSSFVRTSVFRHSDKVNPKPRWQIGTVTMFEPGVLCTGDSWAYYE